MNVIEKLRRLAHAAEQFNPLEAGTADGVDMTTIAAPDPSLTRLYKPDTEPEAFAVHGGTARLIAGSFWAFPVSSVAPAPEGNLRGYFPAEPELSACGWEVEFETEDSKPTIRMYGYRADSSLFRVIVDGRYVTKTGLTFFETGVSYVELDFHGERKRRRIQFRSMVGNGFGGVHVSPDSTVEYPDQRDVLKVAFTGDSFSDGTGLPDQSPLPDGLWCHVVGHLLGWRDIRQVAVGGTGYIGDAVGKRSPIIKQISRWIDLKPDVVVFAAGFNDPSTPSERLINSALSCYRLVRAGAPEAAIFVVGPWPGAGGQTADHLSKEASIHEAFRRFGDPLSYWTGQNTGSVETPWLTGTGFEGSENGTGNTDRGICRDGIHPTEWGQHHLGLCAGMAFRRLIAEGPPFAHADRIKE